MKLTKTQLHEMISDTIENFEDADMYISEDEIEVADNTQNRIEEAKEKGWLSIDDSQGHEIYSCEII